MIDHEPDAAAADPVELFRAEGEPLGEVERLLEPRGNEEVASRRQLAHEQLEDGRLRHFALVIRLQHGELVQVGEQRARQRDHRFEPYGGRAAGI